MGTTGLLFVVQYSISKCHLIYSVDSYTRQWRIQDFPQGGAPTPKSAIIFQFFAENCMKMKEFGPRGGGGGARPWRPPLDPPMQDLQIT